MLVKFVNNFEKIPCCRESYPCTLITRVTTKKKGWKKLFTHSVHPTYFIVGNVFEESHIDRTKIAEFNAVFNTGLSRFHQTKVIYLTGNDHRNRNCGPKLYTSFLFPDATVNLHVWSKIVKFMTILWLQVTLESRIDALKSLRPFGSPLFYHDNSIDSKKSLSSHCSSLASCCVPFVSRPGVIFYLISEKVQARYNQCRQPLLIVFVLSGLNQ